MRLKLLVYVSQQIILKSHTKGEYATLINLWRYSIRDGRKVAKFIRIIICLKAQLE